MWQISHFDVCLRVVVKESDIDHSLEDLIIGNDTSNRGADHGIEGNTFLWGSVRMLVKMFCWALAEELVYSIGNTLRAWEMRKVMVRCLVLLADSEFGDIHSFILLLESLGDLLSDMGKLDSYLGRLMTKWFSDDAKICSREFSMNHFSIVLAHHVLSDCSCRHSIVGSLFFDITLVLIDWHLRFGFGSIVFSINMVRTVVVPFFRPFWTESVRVLVDASAFSETLLGMGNVVWRAWVDTFHVAIFLNPSFLASLLVVRLGLSFLRYGISLYLFILGPEALKYVGLVCLPWSCLVASVLVKDIVEIVVSILPIAATLLETFIILVICSTGSSSVMVAVIIIIVVMMLMIPFPHLVIVFVGLDFFDRNKS
jgi:hypothetical protein